MMSGVLLQVGSDLRIMPLRQKPRKKKGSAQLLRAGQVQVRDSLQGLKVQNVKNFWVEKGKTH